MTIRIRRWAVVISLIIAICLLAFASVWYQHIDTPSVDSLRVINSAQDAYARTHPEKGFASSLAELGPSPGVGMIDNVLATGRKSGYIFVLNTTPPDSSGRILHYTLVARPEKYGTGSRSFFIDESGVERFTVENRAATVNDPPLPLP